MNKSGRIKCSFIKRFFCHTIWCLKQFKERTETIAERRSGYQNKKPEEKTITVLQETKSLWNFCNNSCDFCIWWWVNFIVYTWQVYFILIFSLQHFPSTWSSHMVMNIFSILTTQLSTRTRVWPKWWGKRWSSTAGQTPIGSGAGLNFTNQTEVWSLRSPDSKKIINEWIEGHTLFLVNCIKTWNFIIKKNKISKHLFCWK